MPGTGQARSKHLLSELSSFLYETCSSQSAKPKLKQHMIWFGTGTGDVNEIQEH